MRTLYLENIEISQKRLDRKIIGNNEGNPAWRKHLRKVIAEALEKSQSVIKPKGIYSFFSFDIDEENYTIELNDQIFYSQFLTARFKHLKEENKPKELGLFIVTIGEEISRMSRDAFQSREYELGYIYDVIGSELVESTANALHKIIEDEQGYCMSRYSPGYNDWDIREQQKLFQLFFGEETDGGIFIPDIGVKLFPSSIMMPEKSISAIIGYSDRKMGGCKDCNQTGCQYKVGH